MLGQSGNPFNVPQKVLDLVSAAQARFAEHNAAIARQAAITALASGSPHTWFNTATASTLPLSFEPVTFSSDPWSGRTS